MKTLTVEFPDAFPDDRIVFIISPVPIRTLLDIVEKRAAVTLKEGDFADLLGCFAPFIQSWTFKQPVSVEGLIDQDFSLVAALLDAWIDGVRDVPRPLPRASSDTTPSEAQ